MEVWLANAAYGDHLGHMGLVLTIITCLMGSSGTKQTLGGGGLARPHGWLVHYYCD